MDPALIGIVVAVIGAVLGIYNVLTSATKSALDIIRIKLADCERDRDEMRRAVSTHQSQTLTLMSENLELARQLLRHDARGKAET